MPCGSPARLFYCLTNVTELPLFLAWTSRLETVRIIPLATLLLLPLPALTHAAAQDCSDARISQVLAPATSLNRSIELDCNLRLSPADIVTKQLVLRAPAASGVTLDCGGATLQAAAGLAAGLRISVISRPSADTDAEWIPVEDVLIKNCRILGSVRVSGMAANGEDKALTASSRREGHTGRVQASAPRGIRFDGNKFIAQGSIPIYFSPGVHHSSILNSEIDGNSNSVAIYLDAESGDNTIQGNRISTETTLPQTTKDKARNLLYSLFKKISGAENGPSLTGRELIAMDGSAGNKIIDNHFSNLDNGGIFLYRNCGEGGNIRHQTPHDNQIVNNVFYYAKYDGEMPAIWLGSRNGNRAYCDLDKGYPFGSSASDLDHASDNFVAQNQFYKFKPNKMIRDDGEANILEDNIQIEQPINRKAGCYLKNGTPSRLLPDQGTLQTTLDPTVPACMMQEARCDDGILSRRTLPCAIQP